MKKAQKYIDDYKLNSFLPSVNFEGDLLVDEKQLAEMLQEFSEQQLRLYIVSGMLPNDFKQLPEKLQCKLVRKHTHAELVDGEKIVYEEQDVLDIIKYVSEGNYR